MPSSLISILSILIIFTLVGAFKLRPRIVNGIPSERGQFPFFAFYYVVSEEGIQRCCGALITNKHILTAAHCLEQFDYIDVNLGYLHSGQSWRKDRQDFYITKKDVFLHPNYTSKSCAHDIALIRLPEAVEFNSIIQPVRLSTASLVRSIEVDIIGNSIGTNGLKTDSFVQYATMMTISITESEMILPKLNELHGSRVMCVKNNNERSITVGDSGGPVIRKDDGTLIAISSFIIENGFDRNLPQGFTVVMPYLEWINQIVKL